MDHNLPSAPSLTAADVMTATVVSASPASSVQDVAKLLLDARISAVPVVDDNGALLGIVSEGDLLGRSAEDLLAGQEWWPVILARPGQMQASETEAASDWQVRDVMQSPVITVEGTTPLQTVADLLQAGRSNAAR